MEKNSLLVTIFEAVCGLVCIGFGIYYIVCGRATHAAVFMVVGAVSIVMAVRALIKMLKQKKDKKEDENNGNHRQ